jgi:hypothetical protein
VLILFRVAGIAGLVLLGAALAIAPIAAFQDRMTVVSGLGIAGIAMLVVAWLIRRRMPAAPEDDVSGEEHPRPAHELSSLPS